MEQNNKEALKQIFSRNLKYFMGLAGETKASLAAVMDYSYSTVSDWVDGKKYPRMDKVQALADHYGVLKSALTEQHDKPALVAESGPKPPVSYADLTPANRAIVDRLIADLAKSQSGE